MDAVVKSIQKALTKLFKRFSDNLMKGNANKCHSLVSKNIRVGNFDMKNSDCEKLLGIKFDHKLTFNSHISDL